MTSTRPTITPIRRRRLGEQAERPVAERGQRIGEDPEGKARQGCRLRSQAEARTSSCVKPDGADTGQKSPDDEDNQGAWSHRWSAESLHDCFPITRQNYTIDEKLDGINSVKKARDAPDREKLSFTEADVLQVELPNKPGALAGFAGKLAAKEINITLGYQTSVKNSEKANVVLAVADLEKAARVR